MSWNTKLGYQEDAKLLIIHADDAGLCHSENRATITSLKNGVVNSCSIMTPCPWFFEMAQLVKENPQFDCGIHLTLTCEWKNYKFGPVAPVEEVSSLVDKDGFFYKSRKDFMQNAKLDEIEKELHAQIDLYLSKGLTPSHIDCHMFTLGTKPEFLDIYKGIGKKYKLPIFLNEELLTMFGLENAKNYLSEEDFVIDHIYMSNYDIFSKGKMVGFYEKTLGNIQKGLNIILIHPAFDDEEMKAVAIDHPNFGAEWRQLDFDFFTSEIAADKLKENNIILITWSEIKSKLFS